MAKEKQLENLTLRESDFLFIYKMSPPLYQAITKQMEERGGVKNDSRRKI